MNRQPDGLITSADKSRDPDYFPFYAEVATSRLKPYELFTYIRIASLIYPNGEPISASDILAERLSKKTVQRSIRVLVSRGMIEAIPAKFGLRTFRLVPPSEWDATAARAAVSQPEIEIDRARRKISPQLRFSVLQRDGFKCGYCGATAAESKLTVDHIYPFSKGGKCTMDNLRTACEECNSGKGSTIL